MTHIDKTLKLSTNLQTVGRTPSSRIPHEPARLIVKPPPRPGLTFGILDGKEPDNDGYGFCQTRLSALIDADVILVPLSQSTDKLD